MMARRRHAGQLVLQRHAGSAAKLQTTIAAAADQVCWRPCDLGVAIRIAGGGLGWG
jgi:hypothetical protein